MSNKGHLAAVAVILGSACGLGQVAAQAVPATALPAQSTSSRIQESTSSVPRNTPTEVELARSWGLEPQEWARYRELMRGPLGIYSPNLDPLTALGIEAHSSDEQRHYAEIQVRAEAQRVEKLLAYQRAYDAAWKRLYPTLQPVEGLASAGPSSGTRVTATSSRIAVFVQDNCAACEERVRQLQAAGRAFDLYFVGSHQEDARIRSWAARTGIDPAKVRERVITLNHDGGRWLAIGGQGELPAVMRQVDGQWRRE